MKYLEDYKEMHRRGKFRGDILLKFENTFAEWVKENNITSVLDYGCGKAKFWQTSKPKKYGLNMFGLYDPAVEEYIKLTTDTFDGVICIDVLEHIPVEEWDLAFHNIFSHAKKAVLMTVCTRLAAKTLPSGANAHVSVFQYDTWYSYINNIAIQHYPNIKWTLIQSE